MARAAAELHRRSVRSWADRDTGMGMIRAALSADAYEAYQAAIAATWTFDPPETPAAERRSSEQRGADAFIDVVGAALRAGETFNALTGVVRATRRVPGRRRLSRTSPPRLSVSPPDDVGRPCLPLDHVRQPA